ncbi:MAG: DegT/DnrJ/EryC1/StrS family aminotransferase [Bacteroidota bacterium]
MQIPFFTLDRQNKALKSMIDQAFEEVMSQGRFILGGKVHAFEEKFASYIGADGCVSCGNGTDAIELILEGLEIQRGDEVIIPDNTWMSLAEAVKRVGGVPVCCDVDQHTFNLSPTSVSQSITDRTFAIIVVHQYGRPADIDELLQIKKDRNLYLIEDCAHAAGAKLGLKNCGNLADAASFSFYPTKNLGAFGDGGAVVSNNEKLLERVRLLGNHGQLSRDQHLLLGRNSRLDELQASFLSVKLSQLDSFNRKRQTIAAKYRELLHDVDAIRLPEAFEGHIYHQFVIVTEERESLMTFLSDQGIGTAIHYPSTISSMDIIGIDQKQNHVAKELSDKVLSLPIFPELTMEEVTFVAKAIRRFFSIG